MKVIELSLALVLATGMASAVDNTTSDGHVPHHDGVAETIHDGDKTNGEIFVQLRSFYVDRTYKGGIQNNRNSWSVGGYAGYMTPEYNGFSAVAAEYGTYGLKIHGKPVSKSN